MKHKVSAFYVVKCVVLWVAAPLSVVWLDTKVSENRAASIFRVALQPWRWQQHGPPKWWYPTIMLHGATTQRTTNYEGVSKSFRTGRLERELQMVQLSATRCSCIILWVSLESFATTTLCIASQRVIIIIIIIIIIYLFRYRLSPETLVLYLHRHENLKSFFCSDLHLYSCFMN
jgi:hypothetical protein